MTNRKRKNAPRGTSPSDAKRAKQDDDSNLTYRIPPHLKDSITKVSRSFRNAKEPEYAFEFNLESMTPMQAFAWGLEDTAESVIVRVKFYSRKTGVYVGFCVHDSVDQKTGGHEHCLSTDEQPNGKICTDRPNILTCVLGRELHTAFSSGALKVIHNITLGHIHQEINRVITMDPTAACIVCKDKLNVKLWTPTTCSVNCKTEWEDWPLPARLAHLLADDKSLDLILCLVYSIASMGTDYLKIYLKNFPTDLKHINSVIDSFPQDLLELRSTRKLFPKKHTAIDDQRYQLLSWLCSHFHGCIVSLPSTADFHAPGFGGTHQFLLLNSQMTRQEKFIQKIQKLGSNHGSVAFHGTPSYQALSILMQGLKASGGGVFYAPKPEVSLGYSAKGGQAGYLKPWKKSGFRDKQYLVLFGCEVSQHNIPWRYDHEHSTLDEASVMIRYIFLYPVHGVTRAPPRATVERTMLDAYTALNTVKLKLRNLEGVEDEEE